MNKASGIILSLLTIVLLSGCQSSAIYPRAPAPVSAAPNSPQPINLAGQSSTLDRLYRQRDEWQGVDYRLGGLSKQGVDCSGFVYLTYRSAFGLNLPRTTEQQSKLGTPVEIHQLRAGDLVFFKTGRGIRHVGIYVEKGLFLHASTSKGVIMSQLDNVYWRRFYWKSMRLKS
jgi:lipoprotein Spr/probable lipoprotein NlpC